MPARWRLRWCAVHFATAWGRLSGACLHLWQTSPTCTSYSAQSPAMQGGRMDAHYCDFVRNKAMQGGAVTLRDPGSRAAFEFCTFWENSAQGGCHGRAWLRQLPRCWHVHVTTCCTAGTQRISPAPPIDPCAQAMAAHCSWPAARRR